MLQIEEMIDNCNVIFMQLDCFSVLPPHFPKASLFKQSTVMWVLLLDRWPRVRGDINVRV